MNVTLADVLTCPRCGPEFGLILLVDRLESRRILEGRLGCANCRERYEVRGGFADMRAAHEHPTAALSNRSRGREEGIRLAALMGVSEAHGFSLLLGPGAALAPAVAGLAPGLEVVAVDASLEEQAESLGVSRMAFEGPFPFRTGSMRAVALTGTASASLEEGARVLGREGRLVLDPAPAQAEARLEAAGLAVLVAERGTVVAVRS